MSVSIPCAIPESRIAVGGPCSPPPGRQNARTRASSRSLSIEVLLTWLNASKSPHRRWIGTCRRRSSAGDSGIAGSVARELAVRGAVRLRRVRPETLDLVLLVGLEVALEPVPLVGL